MSVRFTTLDSGLRVATEHVPGALSVAAGVWVAVGSRDEPAELSGVSHFLEHLLFKGTPNRSAKELARSVDRVGGDMNAFTAKEYTAYYCRLPARKQAMAIELLGDVLSTPSLRADDVETEREVILEELAMDEDQPDDVAYQMFSAAMFPGHPLGRETAGEQSTVEAITAADIRAFFAERYGASAMVLAVAGPVDHDDVVRQAESAFRNIGTSTVSAGRHAPGTQLNAAVAARRDGEQSHLIVGTRGLDRFDPDREALDVVIHALGGGPSSRLFQSIREERGLAYSTYASASCYADAGMVSLYAGTTPDHMEEVGGLLHGALDDLVRDGITEDERETAVGYLTGAYSMGFEGTASRMDRLASQLTTRGEVRPIEEQVARWSAVTDDDTRRVVERVLATQRVTSSVSP